MFAMLRRFFLLLAFIGVSTSAFAGSSSMFPDFFTLGPAKSRATMSEPAPIKPKLAKPRLVRAPTEASLVSVKTAPAASSGGKLAITIDISTQSMTVSDEWSTIYTFDVSTGRKGHATPTGTFHPIRMHQMWYSSKYENAPMPWSIFFHGGYAIHGTTDLKHLGHVASHGCVRLDPANAKLLYDLVKDVGMQNTKVVLLRS